MLLNLIVLKFSLSILKFLDAWWMTYFLIFNRILQVILENPTYFSLRKVFYFYQ